MNTQHILNRVILGLGIVDDEPFLAVKAVSQSQVGIDITHKRVLSINEKKNYLITMIEYFLSQGITELENSRTLTKYSFKKENW